MKKRILSVMLVLVFALLALPLGSVSAAETDAFKQIGTSTITVTHTSDGLTYSGTTGTRWFKWDGSLSEGTISVDVSKSALTTYQDGDKTKFEEFGFLIGSSGNETNKKAGLFVFISYNATKGEHNVRTGYYAQDKWVSGGRKTVTIVDKYPDWATAKNADTFNLKIDFKKDGSHTVYINNNVILSDTVEADLISQYNLFSGDEIGLRTGSGTGNSVSPYSVTLSNFKATAPAPDTGDSTALWVSLVSIVTLAASAVVISKKRVKA